MDLIVTAFILLFCGAVLFVAGAKLARNASKSVLTIVALAGILEITLHTMFWRDSPRIARIFPFSSAILIGRVDPLLGFIAGIAFANTNAPRWRRHLPWLTMLGILLFDFSRLLTHVAPECRRETTGRVCLQSTTSTCGAAAAVTLLREYAIEATEQEMARLCFTSNSGTSALGLYRGLKLKCSGTAYQPLPVICSAEEILQGREFPVLVFVGIDDKSTDNIYTRKWGWVPGVRHAVVVVGRQGDLLNVLDPSCGDEHWSCNDLRVLFSGYGMRLSPAN